MPHVDNGDWSDAALRSATITTAYKLFQVNWLEKKINKKNSGKRYNYCYYFFISYILTFFFFCIHLFLKIFNFSGKLCKP